MNQLINNNRNKIFKIIGFVTFILIAICIFVKITYLFRGNQYNYNDRISVVGLKQEAKDSIDVIYIGGSAAFVYWEPLKAFNEFGFTSYDLATNTIQAESILAYVKYAQQYQNPDLYIIDARAFQYYDEEGSEIGLRVSSDALDIGINRTQLISTYLANRDLETNELALYFDIAKYHTNYDALSNDIAWKLMDNSMSSDFKGCQIQPSWCYLTKPEGVKNDRREELLVNDKKTLIELLEYFEENDLRALFVVCPYSISSEDYSKYNTISDIVSSYGYDFLNTNDFYDEMEIDFSTDFYNENHVNCLGADKYTTYLGNYLNGKYCLPNHKGEESYKNWQELADSFANVSNNGNKTVLDKITYANQTKEINALITNTEDFLEWSSLINDERYTVVAVGSSDFDSSSIEREGQVALENVGLSDVYLSPNYIKIVKGKEVIADNSGGNSSVNANIGQIEKMVSCVVDNENGAAKVMIENTNWSASKKNCINLVVFDNYFRNVVDSIYLDLDGNKIVLQRK